ncbi:DNA mismatch repair protein MutS [Myxococcota bacterium]|nr:DNA mismatch repair protein MutS [Myxococcota bacterium]
MAHPSDAVRATFEALLTERRARLVEAEKTSDLIGNLRLGLAGVTLILVILPLFTRSGAAWWALIPVAGIFVILGKWHDGAFTRVRRLRASVRFFEQGLARLREEWRTFTDDGRELGEALAGRAIYTEDLDLFGPASLFQLLNRASTARGRRTLAEWLVTPADAPEIEARQAAVVELAPKLELREELVRAAAGEDFATLEDAKILAWAEGGQRMPNEGLLLVLGVVQPLFLVGAAIGVYALGVPAIVLVVAVVLHLVTIFATKNAVNARADTLSGPDRALDRYASLIAAVEVASLESPRTRALKARLVASEGGAPSASAQIQRLHGLVNLLDARLNPFFALTVGPLLMWDLNLVLRAERFRAETGPKLRGWLDTIGELEALSSLAALLHERPDYSMPKLSPRAGTFRAEGLTHPLIDRTKVVANDLELGGPGSVLLLSGSNMSGKSTLLRAVGLATVLTRAGAPVAARALEAGLVTLETSVRIVDSLAAGTSHFYAELKRLKHIVDSAAGPSAEVVLYLLDEVLHGTNSRERYIGAVSVIRWLSEQGAIGIVTTHDLALAKVERALPPGRVSNRHFGDDVVGSEIRFDYTLKPGQVASTNALRLMRAVGIDVELTEPPD